AVPRNQRFLAPSPESPSAASRSSSRSSVCFPSRRSGWRPCQAARCRAERPSSWEQFPVGEPVLVKDTFQCLPGRLLLSPVSVLRSWGGVPDLGHSSRERNLTNHDHITTDRSGQLLSGWCYHSLSTGQCLQGVHSIHFASPSISIASRRTLPIAWPSTERRK